MTEVNVLDKVRKLLRLSTSSNANEAALAAAKAQELIDRYQLANAMLSLDAPNMAPIDEPIEDFGRKGAPLDNRKRLDRWAVQLASEITHANACKSYSEGAVIQIIGRPSDVDTVRYLYGYLAREVELLTASHGKGCGRTWCNNFRLGAVETIARKVYEQRKETIRQFRAEFTSPSNEPSTALILANQAITKVAERRAAVSDWVKTNMNLRFQPASRSNYDSTAREAGRKAGESIAIGGNRSKLTSAARGLKS